MFFVGIKDFLRRGEERQMNVVDATDFFEEILKVIALRKARELGDIVESDIDDTLGAALFE